MKINQTIQQIDENIAQVKKQLMALGPMHPGSLSSQYHVCGKSGCKCHASPNPLPHGPYCKLNYVYHGKFTCRFVREAHVAEVTEMLATFKMFRQLADQWVALSIVRAQLGPLQPKPAKSKKYHPHKTSPKSSNPS